MHVAYIVPFILQQRRILLAKDMAKYLQSKATRTVLQRNLIISLVKMTLLYS